MDTGVNLDFSAFWVWFLLFTRFSGLFMTLPGIGTEETPHTFRAAAAMLVALALAAGGITAAQPATLAEGALMLGAEFSLGYLIGFVPSLIISSLAVAGQTTAAAIGLGQATMIDMSLGENVSVLSRLQSMIATSLFLLIDGHHTALRAAAAIGDDVGLGLFRPGENVALTLMERFSVSFELAVTIAGPILVVILVTQFVLGLVTKFVPQVNIFIISLPLTIGIGLFVFEFTLTGMNREMLKHFKLIEAVASQLLAGG